MTDRLEVIRLWSRWWWHHWKSVTLRCLGSDMTGLRCASVLASFLAMMILLWPDNVMGRDASVYLRRIFVYDLVLASFYLADIGLMLWRIYDPVSRPRAEFFGNIFGLLLMVAVSAPIIEYFGFLPLSNAYVLAFGAVRFWLVVRSGNGPSEVGS